MRRYSEPDCLLDRSYNPERGDHLPFDSNLTFHIPELPGSRSSPAAPPTLQLMTTRPIDQHAIRIPQASGLLPCLYIPIAARSLSDIETYVGSVVAHLAVHSTTDALLVRAHEPENADARLPIWEKPESAVLHYTEQVWVHVDYRAYRRAYIRAFPSIDLSGLVLDHVMNRRVARLKGFHYLRIVPISRAANSSHGSLSENWGFKYHSSPRMMAIHNASQAMVQYADLSDIVKMLNITGGGSLMADVNDAQKLVDLPIGLKTKPLEKL